MADCVCIYRHVPFRESFTLHHPCRRGSPRSKINANFDDPIGRKHTLSHLPTFCQTCLERRVLHSRRAIPKGQSRAKKYPGKELAGCGENVKQLRRRVAVQVNMLEVADICKRPFIVCEQAPGSLREPSRENHLPKPKSFELRHLVMPGASSSCCHCAVYDDVFVFALHCGLFASPPSSRGS